MFKCTHKISSGESTNIQTPRDAETVRYISSPQSCLTEAHLICLAHLRAFFCHTTWWQLRFFAKDATRMSPIGLFFFFWSHFALEKFLQVQRFFSLFWMMFFQSQSRKEDWKRSRRNEDVSTAAVGRGENQGQWKTDEQKSSKGSAMVSRCTDSKG